MQKSTLLVPGSMLLVQPALAMAIGFNEALFLQQLHYWLQQKVHIYDSKSWIYNTYEDWEQQFPFLSARTIRRVVKSLREQNLIQTTTNYNQRISDKMLWYTLNYDVLAALEIESDDWSNRQNLRPSRQAQRPVEQYQWSTDQNQRPDQPKPDVELSQPASIPPTSVDTLADSDDNVNGCVDNLADSSIYKKATTKTNTEITTTTREEEDPVAIVVVALSSHGLSRPISLGFAKRYTKEYLCEKMAFLEFEKARRPDLANPAGWLRRAIEQDFAPPPGYQTPEQQAAADRHQVEMFAAQRQEYDTIREQEQAKAAAQLAQQLAILQPRYGTTLPMLTAWASGRKYATTVFSAGSVLQFLDQTVLVTFADGHAQIGVWNQVALDQLELRGKQIINEALAYAMRDALDGGSGTYELVLVADGGEA